MLSSPNASGHRKSASVTIDFTESQVIAKVQRPLDARHVPRLIVTKQTIFDAILLHHLLSERGEEFASSLIDQAVNFSGRAAHQDAEFWPYGIDNGFFKQPLGSERQTFLQEVNPTREDFGVAREKTLEALSFLEQEGLAVDPAFTPEIMVLAGLLPMHFSVRTPQGEHLYREIKVNAPMWSLDVMQGSKNGRPYSDVEFRFRGIWIVRKAITAMAAQYLESEEGIRRDRGQPVLPRGGPPGLDDE